MHICMYISRCIWRTTRSGVGDALLADLLDRLMCAPTYGISDRHVEDPTHTVAEGVAARHRLKFIRLWLACLPLAGKPERNAMSSPSPWLGHNWGTKVRAL